MKKLTKLGLSTIFGGLLFALAGVVMLLCQVGIEGSLIALPIAIISIGGLIAVNGLIILIGRLVGHMARKGSAFAKEVADGDKTMDIIAGDERNIALDNKVAAKVNSYMNLLTSPMLIFLIVMQVELVVTLVFLAIIVIRTIMYFLLRRKYNKEM